MARMQETYRSEVVPQLMTEFQYSNVMQVPQVKKIVVNIGLGEAVQNARAIEAAVGDLTSITGQKPVVTRAKKSIAAFKLRAGMPIGAMVTLRGERMYEFLDRLINIALPRVRDFRGLTDRSFDGGGNYAFGIKEHIVFPEIDYDKIDRIWGMDVIICTSAKSDAEARALIDAFNFPFRKPARKAA